MKILARRQPESIQALILTQDFAKLIDIKRNPDGTETYVYSMYVDVDIITAIENNVTHVVVEFFPDEVFVNPPVPRLSSDNLSVETFVQSIQMLKSNAKDRLATIKSKKLFSTKFEILSQIDTSLQERLRTLVSREEKFELLPLKKTVLQQRITNRTSSSSSIITASTDTSLSDRALVRGNLKLASLSFMMRHGDAGKYAETLGKAGNAEAALDGTKQVINNKKRKRVVSNREKDLLANDIDSRLISSLQGKDDTHVAVTGYIRETSKRIRHQFEIPAESISGINRLRVRCEVYGKKRGLRNTVIQRITSSFSHVGALREFKAPKLSPKIVSVARVGPRRNSVEIIQKDPSATVVKLYRRSISSLDNFNDSAAMSWQFVTQFNMRKDDVIKYVDDVDNSKTVTYRAIAVDSEGEVCPTYDAAVVEGTLKLTKNVSTKNASFYILQTGDNSTITLTNVQIDALAYSFKKRNLTRNQKEFVEVGRFGERIVINDQGTSALNGQVIDYDVDPENIYEYICIVHNRTGTTSVSDIRQVYHHRQSSESKLNLVISEVQTVNNSGQTDVTFKMISSVDPDNLDNVKMLLERAGVYELFRQQIFDERSKLSDLLCHHVRRYDHMTGELVSFGAVTDEVFSDRKYGRRYNILPPTSGHRYTYMVSTVLRRPETMFEDYQKTVQSTNRITGTAANSSNLTTQQYNIKPTKSLHPQSLRKGSITSEASRKANYGFDELLYGELGNDVIVQIGGSQTESISIQDFDSQILDEDSNIITWSTNGNSNSIDYHILSVVDDNGNVLDRVTFHQLETSGIQTYRHNIKKLQNTPIRYNLMSVSVLQEIQQTTTIMGPRR